MLSTSLRSLHGPTMKHWCRHGWIACKMRLTCKSVSMTDAVYCLRGSVIPVGLISLKRPSSTPMDRNSCSSIQQHNQTRNHTDIWHWWMWQMANRRHWPAASSLYSTNCTGIWKRIESSIWQTAKMHLTSRICMWLALTTIYRIVSRLVWPATSHETAYCRHISPHRSVPVGNLLCSRMTVHLCHASISSRSNHPIRLNWNISTLGKIIDIWGRCLKRDRRQSSDISTFGYRADSRQPLNCKYRRIAI